MDPNIGKATCKERTVTPCKESLPTSCGPHRKRFLEVQAEIRARMASDKKTLFQEATVSAQRNLILVGSFSQTLLWILLQQVMLMESAHVSATGRLC
jgi:hypothetical protein